MDIEQFRRAGYQAIDRICDHFYAVQKAQVTVRSQVSPGYLREALPDAPPEKGEQFDAIADDFQKLILPGITHWTHPNFFAFFPTAITSEAVLADLYASSVSSPGFNWICSPAQTELEAIMMDWSAKLFGLSNEFYNISGVGGGVIQTTASDAALTAIVAARSRYQRRNPNARPDDLVVYTTTQTHSLGAKAALILGLNERPLEVTEEDNFALRGTTLRIALEEDKKAGKHPFIIIATVGTTSSGAIDHVDEVAEVCKDYPDIWIHVDAAWAGVALACPEFREQCYLSTINAHSDSFCTNFHKWGLVNFDASGFWVRNRKDLNDALDITPPFLRSKEADAGTVIDYRNWHLGLGRRFRSLKIWFVLRSYGAEGFREHIRKGIKQNEHFIKLIKAASNKFTIVGVPTLALTVFRLTPDSHMTASPEQLNALNTLLHDKLNARRDIYMIMTKINGVVCLRMAIGSPFTTEEHVDRAFEIVSEEADAAVAEWEKMI